MSGTPPSPAPVIRVGVDLVRVRRVRRLLAEHPNAAETIFTERELAYCGAKRRKHEHLAGRFAVKEAVLKAFGTGLSGRTRLRDVEVVNRTGGKPDVRLHGRLAELARERGLIDVDVSISHTRDLAVAQAVTVWARSPDADPAGARPVEPDRD